MRWLCLLGLGLDFAVSSWRQPELSLEGPVERGFRLVSRLERDLGDALTRCGKCTGSEAQPPAGEIRHRRLAKKVAEARREHTAREAGLVREAGDRPGTRGLTMEKR